MSLKCEICGKRSIFGHNVSHSKRHTNRRWLPNIRKATISLGKSSLRINICTRCLRTSCKAPLQKKSAQVAK